MVITTNKTGGAATVVSHQANALPLVCFCAFHRITTSQSGGSYDQKRKEAINKMRRALDEFVIEGIKTTIPFHRKLMDDPNYIKGVYTTKFMEDFEY